MKPKIFKPNYLLQFRSRSLVNFLLELLHKMAQILEIVQIFVKAQICNSKTWLILVLKQLF